MKQYKPTYKERLHRFLFPEEIVAREKLTRIYAEGLHLPVEVQLNRLNEVSGDLFNKVITAADYQTQLATYSAADRRRDILFSYQMYSTNGTFSGVADRNLDYGLGQKVHVISSNNNDVVQEALNAVRNSPIFSIETFRNIGLDFTMEGELLFVLWYDPVTKLTTISRLPTEDVTIVWADSLTKMIPSMFVLKSDQGDIAYRDWRALDETVDTYLSDNENVTYADDLESNTMNLQHVVVWVVGSKRHRNSGRGQPLLNNITKNSEFLSQFDDQRFSVASRSATYTDQVTVDGTNKDIEDFINREDPYVPYASTFVGNTGINKEWTNAPSGSQTERFNQNIWYQNIAAATSQNHAMGGIPSALSNRSVLDALMEIFIQHIETFQNTIAGVLRTVFTMVAIIGESPDVIGKVEMLGEKFNMIDMVVSLDTPINLNVSDAMMFIEQQRAREDLTPEELTQVTTLESMIYSKFGVVVKSVTTKSDKP